MGAGTAVRRAAVPDAGVVARLLDDFNREFDTETPGTAVLASRLERLLAGDDGRAARRPPDTPHGRDPVGLALVTLLPNVWYDGPVALLDELYVVPPLRSRGLGTALLRAVEALTRDRGGELVEIDVDGEDTDTPSVLRAPRLPLLRAGQRRADALYYRELGG